MPHLHYEHPVLLDQGAERFRIGTVLARICMHEQNAGQSFGGCNRQVVS